MEDIKKYYENTENDLPHKLNSEEIIDYISTIENFFEMNGIKYHEIYFLYKIDFVNEEDRKIEYTMKNKEGKEYLQYEWLDLDKIEKYNILPECIKQILKESKFSAHKINDNLN